ncbi:MAG: LptF/LptG family permease [Syntrophobacteraceae bacterium]|nr:LptF/LptG family permease [Syntrophobacteraceae bacterium]
MNRTLYRYSMKEQLAPFLVCLMGLGVVLMTGRLFQLTRLLFVSSLTVADILELLWYAFPKLLQYALPMAVLLGVLLAFVRLHSDNELIALHAAGVSFWQFLAPVLTLSLLCTLLSVGNMLYITPSTNSSFENKLRSLGRTNFPVLLRDGTFITTIPKLVFYFRKVNPGDMTIEGIFVQDQRQEKIRPAIVAERAQILYQPDLSHITFRISNGIITRIPENLKDAQAVIFTTYDLTLSLDEIFGTVQGDSKGRDALTWRELIEVIRRRAPGERVRYLMEMHQRLALPVGCLALGLVGAPLGALFRHGSRLMGVATGVGVYVAYYVLLSAGKGLAENRLVPSGLAIWLPDTVALLLAGYLWNRADRGTTVQLNAPWRRWLQVRGRLRSAGSSDRRPTSPQ